MLSSRNKVVFTETMKYLIVLTLFSVTFGAPREISECRIEYKEIYNNFVAPSQHVIKIIGGNEAQPHAYPYQVALEIKGLFSTNFCGGSLISPNYVLTSARCLVDGITADVILGAHDIKKTTEPERIKVTSSELIPHDDYDSSYLINDVGLVKLPEPIQETKNIKIVKLPEGDNSYADDDGVVTGWGITKDGDQAVSPVLRYVKSKILSNDVCANIDPFNTILQDSHLCLSGDGNVGACNGDTGGPLVVDGVQIGVFSFNYRFCEVGKPSVFTRLTKFIDWIRDNSDVGL